MPVILSPEMQFTVYGVHVSYVGEDGEMLMMGHVPPRKALAVALKVNREQAGRDWALFETGVDTVEDALEWFHHLNGEFRDCLCEFVAESDDEPAAHNERCDECSWWWEPVNQPAGQPVTLFQAP